LGNREQSCLLKKCPLPSAIGTGYLSGDSLELPPKALQIMAMAHIYISQIPGAEVFARDNERFRTIARDNGLQAGHSRDIQDGAEADPF
jgi:hypothetical protein